MQLTENQMHLLITLFDHVREGGFMGGDFKNIQWCFQDLENNKDGESKLIALHNAQDHPGMVCYFNESGQPTIKEIEWVEWKEKEKKNVGN